MHFRDPNKPEQRMIAEERAAVPQVSETLEVRNGRYRIGTPWKESTPKFTNNYDAALVQLKSQEKSFTHRGAEVMIFQDYERQDFIH